MALPYNHFTITSPFSSTHIATPFQKRKTSIMDEDLIAFGCFMVLFLAFPFLAVLGITGCVAYGRTKAWDKARNERAVRLESSESNPLVENDENSDFYDTDDEIEHNARKAEEEADRSLTFRQKFRKEFKKMWNGKAKVDLVKQKEREDRRKLAKAVARELNRIERRKARAAKRGTESEDLPPYQKA